MNEANNLQLPTHPTLVIPDVIKSLPEYNEILYHAKTLTNDQFREYWDEVQGNVL